MFLSKEAREKLKQLNSRKVQPKPEKAQKIDWVEIDVADDIKDEEEVFDESCIVENPDEAVLEFPLLPAIELTEKLPFFKSVTYKLEKVFS